MKIKHLVVFGTLVSSVLYGFQLSPKIGKNKTGSQEIYIYSSGTRSVPIKINADNSAVRFVDTSIAVSTNEVSNAVFYFENVSSNDIAAGGFVYRIYSGEEIIHRAYQMFDSKLVPGLSLIEPSKRISADFSDVHGLSATPTRVEVTVDLIEFADGSRVGENKHNLSLRVADQRMGAKQVLKYLRMKYQEGGAEGVFRILLEQ